MECWPRWREGGSTRLSPVVETHIHCGNSSNMTEGWSGQKRVSPLENSTHVSPPSHKHIGDCFVAVTAVRKLHLFSSRAVVNFCLKFWRNLHACLFVRVGGMSRFVSFVQRDFHLHVSVKTEHAVGALFTTQSRYFR